MGNVIRVKINRTNNNMGIALAGHRNRNEMGCFIAGLNPKGAASSQNLKVGDEILEVIWNLKKKIENDELLLRYMWINLFADKRSGYP